MEVVGILARLGHQNCKAAQLVTLVCGRKMEKKLPNLSRYDEQLQLSRSFALQKSSQIFDYIT